MVLLFNGGLYGGNFVFNSIILVGIFFVIIIFVLFLLFEMWMEYKVRLNCKVKWLFFVLFMSILFVVWMILFLVYYLVKMIFDFYY